MIYSPARNVIFAALMIVLVLANPVCLLASTETSDAITKLQQLRASQNRHTVMANKKANSTAIVRGEKETAGFSFRQGLRENKRHQRPEIKASQSPGIHAITPSHNVMRTALSKAAITFVNITVNDKEADTLLIGSEPYFSITLGPALDGLLSIYWDRNHNGMTDSMDVPIEEYEFSDNDMHDLDPTVGTFEFLYDQEMADGLNYVVDDFLFTIYTADGQADAAVTFYTDPSPYYVTGTVRDIVSNEPLEGVIVWGDYVYYDMGPMPMEQEGPSVIAVTDTAGAYTLFFPDSGYVLTGTWDHLMMTGGLIPENQFAGFHLTGPEAFNFYYREPLTRIWGTVQDEVGNPLVDIEVRAFHDYYSCPECSDGGGDEGGGGEFIGYTDSDGYYEIGVDPGYFRVEVDGEDLVPDFMIPEGQFLEVTEIGVNTADFVLTVPNSSISGTVLLDGSPYPDVIVHAWSWEFGWNAVMTDMSGNYDIPVYAPMTLTFSDSFGVGGYDLQVYIDDDPGMMNPIIQVSENWGVLPGTSDENIIMQTVTGGISGTFYNSENNQPILDAWEVGVQARNLDNGMHFWRSPDEFDGSYHLWLVDGVYEITAGGLDWYGHEPDTIMISGTILPYDIHLNPVNYQGIFDGRVLDDITNNPVSGASINIGNEYWGNHTYTDSGGYFHFELPNGYYGYHVDAPGYLEYFGDVHINDNYAYQEIRLQQLVINGAIGGMVMNGAPLPTVVGVGGAPVPDAMVHVWNPATDFGFHTMTDMDGHYWFDLPNGIYEIYVEHPDFLPYWDSGLWVSNDTLIYDVMLSNADGFISGRVYDGMDMSPIHDAGIWVVSMDSSFYFDFYSGVDDSGFFHIPVINGIYEVHVDAPGYEHVYIPDVEVMYNDVFFGIPMMMRAFEGPIIHSVQDQPNDQGRWVRMEFGPEGIETDKYMAFSIWRLTQSPMGPFYDFIAYVPSKDWQFYSLVAPTLIDYHPDLAPIDYETEFMVTGHYDEWNFIDGGHNFGFSIDNIVPGVPSGLSLAAITPTYSDLSWDASKDEDFQYFELYRSNDGDFEGLSPLARLVETNYRDEVSNTGKVFHYQLKAVDANGNTSDASKILRTFTTSTEGSDQIPESYSLDQNFPNPFNPTTLIEFALPVEAHVFLEVYNIRGQKVRTLVDGYMKAGYLSVSWDGTDQMGKELSSGTYIYRLKTADRSFTKKMILMK